MNVGTHENLLLVVWKRRYAARNLERAQWWLGGFLDLGRWGGVHWSKLPLGRSFPCDGMLRGQGLTFVIWPYGGQFSLDQDSHLTRWRLTDLASDGHAQSFVISITDQTHTSTWGIFFSKPKQIVVIYMSLKDYKNMCCLLITWLNLVECKLSQQDDTQRNQRLVCKSLFPWRTC